MTFRLVIPLGLCCVAIACGAWSYAAQDDPVVPPPDAGSDAEKPDDASDESPPSAEIPNDWLKDVELIPKTSLGVREEEADAYYRILDHVRRVPRDKLIAADRAFREERIGAYEERIGELFETEKKENLATAQRFKKLREAKAAKFRENPFSYPIVVDAFNRSAECEGRVLSFHGHARRPKKMAAGENAYGISTLYEIYLFDEDGRGAPVVVVFSELPEGFPITLPENEIIDGVTARGYLFKLYAYEGQEQLQAVPLILAKTIEWTPPEPVSHNFPAWMYGLLVVVGVVILAMVFRRPQRDPEFEAARRRMSSPDDNPFENAHD